MEHRVPWEVTADDAALTVRCGEAEAFVVDEVSALVAARQLLEDAAAAPPSPHGRYCTVSFYGPDGGFVGALDQARVVDACRYYAERG